MTKAAELAKMGEVLTNSQIGRKNMIINGAMQVAQRATSATGLGASNGYFALDRYNLIKGDTSAGRVTMTQSTVTDLEGFSTALKLQCTTADTSIAAGELLLIAQDMEGLNVQQIKATSTSMRTITLSFYAKSNASRAISTEFRLSSSSTNRQATKVHTIGTSWARYTFTILASSGIQIDNGNSVQASINFWLHAGSTYTSGTANATLGASNNANRAAGIGSIFASTDNTFEITGIQLEVGEQATPFEHRSFGEELALCQRYYHEQGRVETGNGSEGFGIASAYSTSTARTHYFLPTKMRAIPTFTATGSFQLLGGSAGGVSGLGLADGGGNPSVGLNVFASSLTAGQAFQIRSSSDVDAFFAFDAEL